MGQIAIALSHSRRRAATARREGSGHDCQHRLRQTRSAHPRLVNTYTTLTRQKVGVFISARTQTQFFFI